MTKDDNSEPPKKQPKAILSEARKEELERARNALLQWMAEKLVKELVEEQCQQRAKIPDPLASAAHTKPQKPARTRAAKKPGRSKQPQPQTAPPRWKPESET
ncbi:MAG: hypothetical protein L6Q69_16005 [Zoogloea sp.]|nr:hypothetical protein [Zoogloea sp.]